MNTQGRGHNAAATSKQSATPPLFDRAFMSKLIKAMYYVLFFLAGAFVATELNLSATTVPLQTQLQCPPPPPPVVIRVPAPPERKEVAAAECPKHECPAPVECPEASCPKCPDPVECPAVDCPKPKECPEATACPDLYASRPAEFQTVQVDFRGQADKVKEAKNLVVETLKSTGLDATTAHTTKSATGELVLTFAAGTVRLDAYVWLDTGAVSVDLHTNTSVDLVPFVTTLADNFGANFRSVRWKIFTRDPATTGDLLFFGKKDLTVQMLEGEGSFWRQRIGNFQSKYQNIQVWETDNMSPLDPTVTVNRVLYLDETQQSATDDEIIYHEHLIHPAMLAHPTGAKKVAILGGGEGASLRETLRHSTVTEAYMIELDGGVVEESKKYLQQMNNCSFGEPGYKSCFDDPRTRLVLEDCVGWFKNRFKGDACAGAANESKFDVIVMDLLDPEYKAEGEFAKYLYSKKQIETLACALNDDGVFVAQLGESPFQMSGLPGDSKNKEYAFKVDIVDMISRHFAPYGTFVYSRFIPSFKGPWTYVLACKSTACVERWHSNIAAVDLAKRQRLIPAAYDQVGFDGASQAKIQQIPLEWQELYCDHTPASPSCDFLRMRSAEDGALTPESYLTADSDSKSITVARAVGTNVNVGMYGGAAALEVPRSTLEALRTFADAHNLSEHKQVVSWFDKYSQSCDLMGGRVFVPLNSVMSLVDQGCGETAIAARASLPVLSRTQNDTYWNPPLMRHAREFCTAARATKGLEKGTVLRTGTHSSCPQ